MIEKIEMIEKIGMIVSLDHRLIETLNLWDNEQMNQWTNGSMDKCNYSIFSAFDFTEILIRLKQ
ncbi:MAG: hypothetical protein KKG06_02345, partial [Bacteroidetes bacterium]|nr:hypothetical protein [Bacteroidota bacterium]